jgi:hypothetical protein
LHEGEENNMGASVIAYWPGLTDEQMESMPGFYNDDKAWGDWMAEREDDRDVLGAVRRLKAEAIMTFKTDGLDDEDVTWVTPEELRTAAMRLRSAVQAGSQEAAVILRSYEINANRIDPVAEEFIRDLDDIVAMTKWAEEQGATKMTLEVNW